MTDAFSGIRVLDFTSTIAGPHCARLLADLGADVIKIEPPDGDMMRSRLPLRNGASTLFGQLNAGKRCVVLDLKRPDAVAAAKRLAGDADVVVENFRPGVMARLGLDYPTLAALNPRLIYCAISGYGQTGPSAARPALPVFRQARTTWAPRSARTRAACRPSPVLAPVTTAVCPDRSGISASVQCRRSPTSC